MVPHDSPLFPMALLPEPGEFPCKQENQATHWSCSKVMKSKVQIQNSRLVVCFEFVLRKKTEGEALFLCCCFSDLETR